MERTIMGLNNKGFGFPAGGRRQANAGAVGRPYGAGSAMDPHSIGNAAVASGMSPPLSITNGFDAPAQAGGLQITNGFGFPSRQMAEDDGENFANGGMVRGPGTGTSDSVKDAVPPGTFIMPADSTKQIGAVKLSGLGFRPGMREAARAPEARLGFKSKAQREAEAGASEERGPGLGFRPRNVPVNLSNGEFRISPQQVHAIGAEVLEGLKAATHEPVEIDSDNVARDGLFFADGGLVGQPSRDPFAYQAPGSTLSTPKPAPIPGAERDDLPARDPARTSFGQIGGPATVKPATPTTSPVNGPFSSIGTAYGATANKMTFGAFDSRGDDIRQQNRQGLIAEPEKPAVAPPGPGPTTNPGLMSPAATSPTPAPAAAPAPLPGMETSVAGVRRIDEPGKSPLFTNVGPDGASFGVRPGMSTESASTPAASGAGLGFRPGMGTPAPTSAPGFGFQSASQRAGGSSPDVMGILQRESQIRAGMGALRDEIAFNNGSGGSFRQTTPEESLRDMLAGGTSRDKATALNYMGSRQDAADRANQAQQELGLREEDMLGRQGIAAGDLQLRSEDQGFKSAAARRLQGLQDRFVAEEDPVKRGELAQQLRELGGRDPVKPDSGMAVARANLIGKLSEQYATMAQVAADTKKPIPSFEAWSAPLLRAAGMGQPNAGFEEGKVYVDNKGNRATFRNGKWEPVLPSLTTGNTNRPAPAVGDIVAGRRFRGRNPNDRLNWEAV